MQNNKNFQEALLAHINEIENLPMKARLDYFEDDKDDLVINALPGGSIDKQYMDGTREVSLKSLLNVRAIKRLVIRFGESMETYQVLILSYLAQTTHILFFLLMSENQVSMEKMNKVTLSIHCK